MTIADVALTLGPAGPTRVVVDGEDLSQPVKGVWVESEAGQLTRVTLRVPAGVELTGQMDVHVVQDAGDVDPKDAVRAFLAAVPWDMVLDHAMQNASMDAELGPMLGAHLTQLVEEIDWT